MLGQIHLGTQFGAVLRAVAARPDLKSFVEVGTWNGRGSTESLMAGLEPRSDDWSLLSLDINTAQHELARQRWAGAAPGKLRLELGRLSTVIMHPDEVAAHPLSQSTPWREWYAGELADARASPVVPLPPVVDFVLLDGGEFTTCGDWQVAQQASPRVVALDDTRSMKCADINAQLLADPAWRLLASGDERNGWAVFERHS